MKTNQPGSVPTRFPADIASCCADADRVDSSSETLEDALGLAYRPSLVDARQASTLVAGVGSSDAAGCGDARSAIAFFLVMILTVQHFIIYSVSCSRGSIFSFFLNRFFSRMFFVSGQYRFDEEPNAEQHSMLVRFEPYVLVQHTSQGVQARRLGLRGSDGRLQYFAVQSAYTKLIHSDERLVQLHVILNRLLGKYKETRKRQLAFTVSPVIPLSNRMRLIDAPDDAVTMAEVFHSYILTLIFFHLGFFT
jgi:hypothetical protein